MRLREIILTTRNNRVIKIMELGLCKGKKLYDKRATAAARDAKRDIDRALKTQR